MKIGVLTFFRPINHGAVYQACATSNIVLKKYADKVELIDYQLERTSYYRRLFRFSEYSKLISRPHVLFKRIITDIWFAPVRYKQRAKFDRFVEQYLHTSKPCRSKSELEVVTVDYDVLVVGSDLVWNPEMTGGINDVFYLQFAQEYQKKISYAASIGTSEISKEAAKVIGHYLDTFDAISVRENTAQIILERQTVKNVTTVLDPTLLTTAQEWNEYKKPYRRQPEGKYLLVYMLELSSVLIEGAKKIAADNGFTILTYGSKKYFGKDAIDVFDAGPDEMLSIISNADVVVTNSFHGCAFSILFEKEFWCVPHSTRGTRMTELLKALELEERVLMSLDQLNNYERINYEMVSKYLCKHREHSFDFLEKAFEDNDGHNM